MDEKKRKFLYRWALNAFAVYIISGFIPGMYVMMGTGALAAIVLGLVNAGVKEMLERFKITATISSVILVSIFLNIPLLWIFPEFWKGFVIAGWAKVVIAAVFLGVLNGMITIKLSEMKKRGSR